jgi:phosphoribosyl-ATP pyrophosphohydrolase
VTDKNQFKKLEDLWNTIEDRIINSSPKNSYVSYLVSKGIKECAKKVGEEAVETSLAALSRNKEDAIKESADLLFHLLVLWKASGLKPEEIMNELKKRESISGLTEKQNRNSGP